MSFLDWRAGLCLLGIVGSFILGRFYERFFNIYSNKEDVELKYSDLLSDDEQQPTRKHDP